MGSIFAWVGGTLGVVIFLIVGLVQIYAGYLGIEYHLGSGWAIGAVIATLFFQFPIILTVGTFFGALDVWGWPWYGAAVFAMPGLLFALPGVVGVAIVGLTNLVKGKPQPQYDYQPNINEPVNVTPTKKKIVKRKKITRKKTTRKK